MNANPRVGGAHLGASEEAARIFADASPIGDDEARWADASRSVMRLLVHRIAAARGMEAAPLPVRIPEGPMVAGCRALMRIEDVSEWGAPQLGPVYEHLLASRPGTARESQGSWFTPVEIAREMCRMALGLALEQKAGDALLVRALDPACGAGVFLVEASRFLAAAHAQRVFGEATPAAVRAVLPEVMTTCVFGIDIDPIAAEIARAVLWLECRGALAWDAMARNVICGNALDGDEPPALTDGRRRKGREQVAA